jgi:hypothetical protein
MPVEIREMVVKAKVPARERREGEAEDGQNEEATPANQAQLVEACVAAVMKILEKKSWR